MLKLKKNVSKTLASPVLKTPKTLKPPASPKLPKNEIVRVEGKPRKVRSESDMIWVELGAFMDEADVSKARAILHSVPLSAYTVLDKQTKERLVMTTESTWLHAIHLLTTNGVKVWGV